jgi:adenylosuccinate lyase
MIARYTRPNLAALWSEARKLATQLEVELAACEALEAEPNSPIPVGTTATLRQRAQDVGPLDAARIAAIEQTTQHDVLAFLTHVEERLGEEARYLHFGLTSSDVLDTTTAILLRDAADEILGGLREALLPALAEKARAQGKTPMIGRSHGMHAEPVCCGLLFAGAYAEIRRAEARLLRARQAVAVGKLSGAVGVYGSGGMSPVVEARALKRLGLSPETVATQVVARDRHAELLQALALLAAAVERLAINLRHLQRSEVGEIEEAFRAGQKGSSAMPHKKNPISAENLCGLSRLVRSHCAAALENIGLWHERDISHSSVERVILPDATTLSDYLVQRAASLVRGLVVRDDRMARNLAQGGGLYASEKVMLALVQTGLSRRGAYELVQGHALSQGQENSERTVPLSPSAEPPFLARLLSDPRISERLSHDRLRACFDLDHHLRHVEAILARALSEPPG